MQNTKLIFCVPRQSIPICQKRDISLKPKSIFSSQGKNQGPPYNHVVQIGDPILRQACDPIDPKDIKSPQIKNIIKCMKFALKRYDGVGISAPQIGVPAQISIIQLTKSQMNFWTDDQQKQMQMEVIPLKIFINPQLFVLDKSQVTFNEGCSSMHGFSALVPRYKKVKITGLDENGQEVEWVTGGWGARVAQHEFDHLQGKMFIDRAELQTLSFDYWKIVNSRLGDFRLAFDGIKPGINKFVSSFFHQKK